MTEASASQLGRACGVYGAFGYRGSTALSSTNINSPIHPAMAGCRMSPTPHASRALKPMTPQRPAKEATTHD